MELLGARRDRIVAAIGPTIAQKSYEVDAAFAERFCATDPAHEHFFAAGRQGPDGPRFQFDLEGFIAARLAAAGLGTVVAMGVDTYADEERWFSFRRTTHRGEPDYGRQLSLIALPA
jgi:copper oxidase (laccase) domain-containing protein